MPFLLAIFDEQVLSRESQTEEVLRMLTECNVSNVVTYNAAGTTLAYIKEFAARGNIFGAWPCSDNQENVIRDMLAYYKIPARDALYVGCTATSMGNAKKAGVTTFCFASGYHSPAYIQETKPRYLINFLRDVLSVVRAQL